MNSLPLNLRPLRNGAGFLGVNDAGGFFAGTDALLQRFVAGNLSAADKLALAEGGHLIEGDNAFANASHAYGKANRLTPRVGLNYLILVPTLRCNLSCSYCQVSRAPINQTKFDWSEDTLSGVLKLIDDLAGDDIKIEFQGGEPTLRLDLIEEVIGRCERFTSRQFAICTNLQELSSRLHQIIARPDVFVSTSLDGDAGVHAANRTASSAATSSFLSNLDEVLQLYGPAKVSALPTINPADLPDIDALIDAYASRGLNRIFLRPINYQGFARKRHAGSREQSSSWFDYHERFVRRLIERNWLDRTRVLEETYLGICLRRIFQPGRERYVDLRNPNPIGVDYVVIDHDGKVYPTDECRMLARAGVIDLSIGSVEEGWDTEQRRLLDQNSTNEYDPDCIRCAYKPFCGRDIVDDLARYGRVDLPRRETEFCRRHTQLFDLAFDLIYSDEPAVKYSLSRWLDLPGIPTLGNWIA